MVRREGDDPAARNARVDDTTQREDNGGTRAAHQETEKSTWDWVLQSWRRACCAGSGEYPSSDDDEYDKQVPPTDRAGVSSTMAFSRPGQHIIERGRHLPPATIDVEYSRCSSPGGSAREGRNMQDLASPLEVFMPPDLTSSDKKSRHGRGVSTAHIVQQLSASSDATVTASPLSSLGNTTMRIHDRCTWSPFSQETATKNDCGPGEAKEEERRTRVPVDLRITAGPASSTRADIASPGPPSIKRWGWSDQTLEEFSKTTLVEGAGLLMMKRNSEGKDNKLRERVLSYNPETMKLIWTSTGVMRKPGGVFVKDIEDVLCDGLVVTIIISEEAASSPRRGRVMASRRGSAASTKISTKRKRKVFETTKERDAQIVRAILLLLCRQARATGAASESTKSAHNASIPRASAAATTPPDKCPGFPCSPGPSGSSRSPKKGSIERYETASDWRGIKRNLARSRPTEESKYSTL